MASNIPNEVVTVYVRLLEEGTPTSRPTRAEKIGSDGFRLLATPNYDPGDERWEFLPGSVVRCEAKEHNGERYLLAVGLSVGSEDRRL